MSGMLKWHKDLFTNVFRGTNNIKLTFAVKLNQI